MAGIVRAGSVLAIAGVCALVAPAVTYACSWPASDPVYEVDPAAHAEDQAAPTAFTNVDAMVWRREGETCKLGQCTSNNCGDMGHVEIFFDPPQDNRTPMDDLGFRIEVLEGSLPPSLQSRMMQPRALDGSMIFNLGFDDATRVDAVIALVAIDRAGNESPPSDPIHLSFSGCTKAATGDLCKEGGPFACRAAGGSTGWSAFGWLLVAGMSLLARRVRWRRAKA